MSYILCDSNKKFKSNFKFRSEYFTRDWFQVTIINAGLRIQSFETTLASRDPKLKPRRVPSRLITKQLRTRRSENRFCQDTQLRHRKSPRKRLRVTRTLALVIDQLRSSFQRAGDFTPRMRARRNWRSEFLRRYLSDNRRGDNEECATVRRGGSCCRSFVRETPRIYSIGLRSCARNLSDGDDLLNALGAIRNFWRRFRR